MIRPSIALLASLLVTSACGSHGAPGQPDTNSEPIAPAKILDFALLYGRNCAGCHGENGNGGAAIGLADPVYLAIADDAAITRATADGVPGSLARAGRNLGKISQDVRGKANHEALIILMNIEVNAHMDIPEGKRKEAPQAKLQDAYDHLDAIGDSLVQKLRAALQDKKGGK